MLLTFEFYLYCCKLNELLLSKDESQTPYICTGAEGRHACTHMWCTYVATGIQKHMRMPTLEGFIERMAESSVCGPV